MSKKAFKKIFISCLLFAFVVPATFVQATVEVEEGATEEISAVESINLSGENKNIEWSVNGESVKGFKVVWSKNEHPTYPIRSGDKYHYYSDPNKNEDTLSAFSGAGTYYVRVCEYLGGACGVYSNEISVALGEEPVCENCDVPEHYNNNVESIELSVDGTKITWSVVGTSTKGFKVVWSKNEHPTYPTRSGDKYHYYSDPNKNEDTLSAFSGAGTYYVRVCEYLGGACGVYSNEVSLELASDKEEITKIACTMEYAPVCGKDGRTYSNKCVATNQNGVELAYDGECKKDEQISKIEKNAELLNDNKLDDILAELQELRDLVKEQQTEIKYLHGLVSDLSDVTDSMKESINSFITYGVDDNTKMLGAGERAAVIYSYKDAFGKLPENDEEFGDAIKIANGRWPSEKSELAEEQAKENFQKIYKRVPDMNNENDQAAIKVMAYGLRQNAKNRNLESEKNGIAIYQGIYGKTPESTEDWNTMQAITYSGATRGIDSDGDLLVDTREAELGTDPNNPDTDGDSFLDGIEVANGYDPLNP